MTTKKEGKRIHLGPHTLAMADISAPGKGYRDGEVLGGGPRERQAQETVKKTPKKRVPLFDSDEKMQALETEAKKWFGTPYLPQTMIMGVGADCLRLPCALYRAYGILQGFEFPDYKTLQSSSRNQKLIEEGLKESGFIRDPNDGIEEEKVDGEDPVKVLKPKCGSLVLFKIGKEETIHLGLALTSGFIHVMPSRRARRESFTEKWQKRLVSVWEPTVEVK